MLNAATAYMDVLRDTANLEVQRNNVRVLQETLKQTRDRFEVGEVTKTDVAQAEAQLAAGQSAELAAESTLTTSKANYRQIILVEPVNLAPGSPVDRFFPKTLPASIDLGLRENPNVTSAMHGVDVSFLQVKINEGALLPVVSAQISAQQQSEPFPGLTTELLGTATANVTIPNYQGGQRVLAHPPIEGKPWTTTAHPRSNPQSGPTGRGPSLGSAEGRESAGGRRPIPGHLVRGGS
jgi:outer membrane protein